MEHKKNMIKFFIEEMYDVAEVMYNKIVQGLQDVTFVGTYEDAVEVVGSLLAFDGVQLYQVQIEPEDWDGYDKEYLVTLDEDLNIWCEKAYRKDSGSYVYMWSSCILVADDCNSFVLKELDADEFYEVSYDLDGNDDIDCDGNCECCRFGEKDEDEELLSESDSKNEYTNISRTKNGKVAGFTKSWSTVDNNGTTHYSSFSHYGDNEEVVKKIAREFGINI